MIFTWLKLSVDNVCVLSHFSHIPLCACQAPLSMGFSRQESWSGLSFPAPGSVHASSQLIRVQFKS